MKKKLILLTFLIFVFCSLFISFLYYKYFLKPINVVDYNLEVNKSDIYVTLNLKKSISKLVCAYDGLEVLVQNNTCKFKIQNEETTIEIKNNYNKINYSVNPNINKVVDFTLNKTDYYLPIGGKDRVLLSALKLGNVEEAISLTSEDESIVKTSQNTIIGVNPGTINVSVSLGDVTKSINVTVTDLITTPKVINRKPKMTCNRYSKEESSLLDKILLDRINTAGYATRAGVVASLRFITLELPYKIPYFFENGRLNNNTGGDYVDGEGRFYHKGLYLSSDKFSELNNTRFGPSIWGCPLTNWQDEVGFKPGVKYPNGLDCSGFVTWAMYNGGFDVSDTGAGMNSFTDDDLSDLGVHIPITRSLLTSGSIKAGDLIGCDGHIALVGAIKNDIIYVAESTTYYDGVVMHPYTINELLNEPFLDYVINMDSYYGSQGNYTDYFE